MSLVKKYSGVMRDESLGNNSRGVKHVGSVPYAKRERKRSRTTSIGGTRANLVCNDESCGNVINTTYTRSRDVTDKYSLLNQP